jgi:hypothetical protein
MVSNLNSQNIRKKSKTSAFLKRFSILYDLIEELSSSSSADFITLLRERILIHTQPHMERALPASPARTQQSSLSGFHLWQTKGKLNQFRYMNQQMRRV